MLNKSVSDLSLGPGPQGASAPEHPDAGRPGEPHRGGADGREELRPVAERGEGAAGGERAGAADAGGLRAGRGLTPARWAGRDAERRARAPGCAYAAAKFECVFIDGEIYPLDGPTIVLDERATHAGTAQAGLRTRTRDGLDEPPARSPGPAPRTCARAPPQRLSRHEPLAAPRRGASASLFQIRIALQPFIVELQQALALGERQIAPACTPPQRPGASPASCPRCRTARTGALPRPCRPR